MEVLLIQTVDNLGQAGDIKKVADGYARNYLIPQGLAVLATKSALKQVDRLRRAEAQRQARTTAEASALADILAQATVTFKAKTGEKDRLYGSVTNANIAEALEREIGQAIDKRKIDLPEPIRELGTYQVPVKLSAGLTPHVTVIVEREEQDEE